IPTYPPTEPTDPIDSCEAADGEWPEPTVEAEATPSAPEEKSRGSPLRSREVQSVYGKYREYHQQTPGMLKSKSKAYKAIAARLDEGWSVEALHKAIEGYHCSPWHLGDNPSQKPYLG